MRLIRIEYKGVGIYSFLRSTLSKEEWIDLLNSDALSWLSKPEVFNGRTDIRSYFTQEGYDKFIEKTLPVIAKHVDTDKLHTIQSVVLRQPIYKDGYQIVFEKQLIPVEWAYAEDKCR